MPISTQTHVSLIIHKSEITKTTNTGRIAHKLIPNSQMRLFGIKDKPLQKSDFWRDDHLNILLYPMSDVTIDQVLITDKPVNLIVPDGNWSQAATIAKKIRLLVDLPTVGLPLGARSEYILRAHPDPHRICTIEAIYRSLCYLENGSKTDHLIEIFRMMRDRILSKGGSMRQIQNLSNLEKSPIHRHYG